MTGEQQHGFMRRLRRFLSPAEELEAEDLKERSRDCGASPLAECCDRSRVKVRGTVRWVTSLDMGGVEALLTDGTGKRRQKRQRFKTPVPIQPPLPKVV